MIKVNGETIEFSEFPNGETKVYRQAVSIQPMTTYPNESWDLDYSGVPTDVIDVYFQSDLDLTRLMFVKNELDRRSDRPKVLRLTQAPYARMDRTSSTFAFTLQDVAEYINWLDFDSVHVMDPHSDVFPALIKNCNTQTMIPRLVESALRIQNLGNNFTFVFPDAGAQKRYEFLLKGYAKNGHYLGVKHRDFSTGDIGSLDVVKVGVNARTQSLFQTAIIVDDLCSYGGTFAAASEALLDEGFDSILLVVAHCETVADNANLAEAVDAVYTTDSIPAPEDESDWIVRFRQEWS